MLSLSVLVWIASGHVQKHPFAAESARCSAKS